MQSRWKNYGFWTSLISAVLIFLQAIGVKCDVPYVNGITAAVLGVLVVLGIINNPRDGKGYTDTKEDKDKK